jgi:hypothetical protein
VRAHTQPWLLRDCLEVLQNSLYGHVSEASSFRGGIRYQSVATPLRSSLPSAARLAIVEAPFPVVEDHLVDHDATASPLEGKDDELPLLERRNRSYGLVFASVRALVNMRPNNIVKIQLIRNRGWIILRGKNGRSWVNKSWRWKKRTYGTAGLRASNRVDEM